jgi:methyl-accepting chemotaxis protein
MPSNLKFSQKILLAASLVTIIAFTLFVLFNDYRQRQTLNADVHASLQEVGSLATRNIKTWLDGRIQLVESLAQQLAANGQQGQPLEAALNLPVYGQRFQLTYFGGADGAMTSVPTGNRPADYDPRARGWYRAASAAQGSALYRRLVAEAGDHHRHPGA